MLKLISVNENPVDNSVKDGPYAMRPFAGLFAVYQNNERFIEGVSCDEARGLVNQLNS